MQSWRDWIDMVLWRYLLNALTLKTLNGLRWRWFWGSMTSSTKLDAMLQEAPKQSCRMEHERQGELDSSIAQGTTEICPSLLRTAIFEGEPLPMCLCLEIVIPQLVRHAWVAGRKRAFFNIGCYNQGRLYPGGCARCVGHPGVAFWGAPGAHRWNRLSS